MKKNKFKNHDYYIGTVAFKNNDDGTYDQIRAIVTRNDEIPLGEIVTDLDEIKYACKSNGFDFDSLDIDENSNCFIKKDSVEWNNYLEDPGVSPDEYMEKLWQKKLAQFLERRFKEETGQKLKVLFAKDGVIDLPLV